jgi:hypothetical protein
MAWRIEAGNLYGQKLVLAMLSNRMYAYIGLLFRQL